MKRRIIWVPLSAAPFIAVPLLAHAQKTTDPPGGGSVPTTPKLIFLAKSYTFNTTNGGLWSDFLLPAGVAGTRREVGWKKDSVGYTAPDSCELNLAGASGGRLLLQLSPGLQCQSPTGQETGSCTIEFPKNLPADSYSGELAIRQGTFQATVPVVWNVRTGPSLPLVCIAVGLLLGRVLQPKTPTPPANAPKAAEVDPTPPASPAKKAASRALRVTMGFDAPPKGESDIFVVLGHVVLGIALLVSGFYSLYVSKSVTFGSGGLVELIPLLLWGFGADILNRTLWNWSH